MKSLAYLKRYNKMSQPTYLGDTDWKRQAGGSFGFTKEGLQFREIIYRGRIDSAERFVASWIKGAASPLPGEGHLNLVSAPTVNDENGVSGISTLRFEGVSGTAQGQEENADFSEQWYNELKELLLTSGYNVGSLCKYSYLSPHVVYTYTDDHKRDTDPEAKRFRNPTPWGTDLNNNEDLKNIMGPHFLIEFTDDDAKIPAAKAWDDDIRIQKFEIKQVSGFQTISRDAEEVYTHTEQHFLVFEPIKDD